MASQSDKSWNNWYYFSLRPGTSMAYYWWVWLALLPMQGYLLSGQRGFLRVFHTWQIVWRKEEKRLFFFNSLLHIILSPPFFFSLDKHFVLGYNSPFRSTHLYADRRAAELLHLWALGWLGKSRNMELPLCILVVTLAPLSPSVQLKSVRQGLAH